MNVMGSYLFNFSMFEIGYGSVDIGYSLVRGVLRVLVKVEE